MFYLLQSLVFSFLLLTPYNSLISQTNGITEGSTGIKTIGLPIIRNYLPSDYNATPQNWAIVQDKRGIMYFANTGGVLEYDGISWRLIEVTNDVARTLAIDKNGTIYVGGIDQFGFLKPDSSGNMRYISLNTLLPDNEREFGDIWSIWASERGIYFQSTSHIFLIKDPVSSLETKNQNNIKIWRAESIFSPAFLVNEKYFIPQTGKGLYTLTGDSLERVPGGEKFANETIYDMFSYPPSESKNVKENKVLICTSTGFFLYDSKSFTSFKTDVDEFVTKHKLYFGGAILKDNTYALGTQTGGLLVIDQNGKLVNLINKKNGLHDNTVWFVYPDKSGVMWLGLNNGITRINYPSPLTVIDSRFGLDGIIFSMNEHDKRIYLSTPNGVYYSSSEIKSGTDPDFKLVKGMDSESWEILNLDGIQLVGTTAGIYKIKDDKAVKIKTGWRFAYSLCRSKVDPDIIYVGLHDGLAKLQFVNNEWQDGGKIPGITEIIPRIKEEPNGMLWLSTYNKGLIRIIPQRAQNNTSYSITKFEDNFPGSQVPVLILKDKTIFGTANGVMSFDKEKNEFVPDTVLGNYFTKDFKVIDLEKDSEGSIWIVGTKKNSFEIGRLTADEKGKFKWKSFPQLKIIAENILGFNPYRLFPDRYNKNVLWITASEKLYRFDVQKALSYPADIKFNTLIRQVSINGDSIIYNGGFSQSILSQPGREWNFSEGLNSIELSYSSSSYLQENGNKYRYLLEGFNTQWSDWTSETKKEYTNLPSGDYKFKVQAMNIHGDLGEEASFGFLIPTPWYKSVWALALFTLIIISGIWWVFNFRLRLLEKRNVELESIVNKRTNEVRRQKDILEMQAKKLLELDRMKTNFFTNISHEFRTPLTLVMGQIENLLSSAKEDSTKSKLVMALSNSKRLQSLINRLLELSRLESGEMKLKVTETELNSFLRKILSAFESLTERRNIRLEFNKANSGIHIYIDTEKLEEVFNNLISNAIKFTPEGGKISLTISSDTNGPGFVTAVIKDSGIGIKQEHLPHIFDRFYQVDSSQTREYEGTGIGLAIVKELIELHDGKISVSSEPGEGTEFTIRLPLGKEHFLDKHHVEFIEGRKNTFDVETKQDDFQTNINSEITTVPSDEESNIPEQEVVLVVEDNYDMRSYIRENLEQNFKIIDAKNGEEGVKKAFESIPDLIITDVMMPAMNGFELTGKLKSDNKTSHIPIIMLTAKADEESKLRGLDIGVDDYLIKPFSTKELHARVGNLIKLRRLLKERYKEISAINPSDIEAKPIDKEFLDKVFINIKEHIEDSGYSVTVLANEVGMSVSQLNRKLNALINQSAGKLIRSTRLDYASQLLKNRAGNISEIAYRIGFSDTPGFTHSFKEKFGCSPSEYLKSQK